MMHNLEAARRALDDRLTPLRRNEELRAPSAGWIKAIRQALGMTTAQLGRRIGVSQPRVVELEQAEADRSVTLKSLERAAEALNCRLVYALVPNEPLDTRVQRQAEAVAHQHMAAAGHSMRLEDQGTAPAVEAREITRLAAELLARRPARLWDR
jgi:predicted DNA-binding mobile mystery protein A